jgi:hypothetical protein
MTILSSLFLSHRFMADNLEDGGVEGAVAGTPVSEEERKTNGLEDTGEGTDGEGVERALLSGDLGDEL